MDHEIPDIYADQFNLSVTPYGVSLTFSVTPNIPVPGPGGSSPAITPKAVIRMSLEHAKIMAMIIRRQLKRYELEQLGDPIKVPHPVMQALQLTEADW